MSTLQMNIQVYSNHWKYIPMSHDMNWLEPLISPQHQHHTHITYEHDQLYYLITTPSQPLRTHEITLTGRDLDANIMAYLKYIQTGELRCQLPIHPATLCVALNDNQRLLLTKALFYDNYPDCSANPNLQTEIIDKLQAIIKFAFLEPIQKSHATLASVLSQNSLVVSALFKLLDKYPALPDIKLSAAHGNITLQRPSDWYTSQDNLKAKKLPYVALQRIHSKNLYVHCSNTDPNIVQLTRLLKTQHAKLPNIHISTARGTRTHQIALSEITFNDINFENMTRAHAKGHRHRYPLDPHRMKSISKYTKNKVCCRMGIQNKTHYTKSLLKWATEIVGLHTFELGLMRELCEKDKRIFDKLFANPTLRIIRIHQGYKGHAIQASLCLVRTPTGYVVPLHTLNDRQSLLHLEWVLKRKITLTCSKKAYPFFGEIVVRRGALTEAEARENRKRHQVISQITLDDIHNNLLQLERDKRNSYYLPTANIQSTLRGGALFNTLNNLEQETNMLRALLTTSETYGIIYENIIQLLCEFLETGDPQTRQTRIAYWQQVASNQAAMTFNYTQNKSITHNAKSVNLYGFAPHLPKP